jgi:putative tryptophan/tyrosine transport system substrate-binding protein
VRLTTLQNSPPATKFIFLECIFQQPARLSRVAVFGTSTQPGNAQALKESELAAATLGVKLQFLEILSPKDIEIAFGAAGKGRADAGLVLNSPVLFFQRSQIADLAVKSRLATIYYATDFVEAGGLMTYGVSVTDLYRRAATYVDKILKGVKPSDLPVEQPKKFEFIINLKAAKQIGLTIPPNVLARADRVIK